jgi:hypothetical protein
MKSNADFLLVLDAARIGIELLTSSAKTFGTFTGCEITVPENRRTVRWWILSLVLVPMAEILGAAYSTLAAFMFSL